MSVNHEPATDFEKKAAAELSLGKTDFSAVEKGFYRRVVAIPLGGGCVNCHSGAFTAQSQVPRYAGLVISIPVREE